MPELLIGIAALVGILVLLRAFVTTNPSTLVRALRYAGVICLAGFAAALFFFHRVDLGFIVGGMAYGLYTQGHILPGGWPPGRFSFLSFLFGLPRGARRSSGGAGASGQTSRVSTAWLDLELDHDTGEMQGQVLQGAYNGKALAALSPDDLMALYGEAGAADPETARLLETYLDRRLGPEWRLKQQHEQPKSEEQSAPRGRRDSGMSRDEAYAVLGLQPGASEDEVRAAHKKLMMQNHPDRGGTNYIAAKINEAKDVLTS